jgi:hypothetical protein
VCRYGMRGIRTRLQVVRKITSSGEIERLNKGWIAGSTQCNPTTSTSSRLQDENNVTVESDDCGATIASVVAPVSELSWVSNEGG